MAFVFFLNVEASLFFSGRAGDGKFLKRLCDGAFGPYRGDGPHRSSGVCPGRSWAVSACLGIGMTFNGDDSGPLIGAVVMVCEATDLLLRWASEFSASGRPTSGDRTCRNR